MGLLDKIGALAGDASQGDNAKVIGGLITALQNRPDGIQSVINSFQQNGLGEHAAAMTNGEAPALTPEQVDKGFSGTGLIEEAAQHAGVSPQVVQMAMTTVLPLVLAHFSKNDGAPATDGAAGSGLGGVAESLLKKLM
jgi:uncharacterized protein YidB (DUF937 family)